MRLVAKVLHADPELLNHFLRTLFEHGCFERVPTLQDAGEEVLGELNARLRLLDSQQWVEVRVRRDSLLLGVWHGGLPDLIGLEVAYFVDVAHL